MLPFTGSLAEEPAGDQHGLSAPAMCAVSSTRNARAPHRKGNVQLDLRWRSLPFAFELIGGQHVFGPWIEIIWCSWCGRMQWCIAQLASAQPHVPDPPVVHARPELPGESRG